MRAAIILMITLVSSVLTESLVQIVRKKEMSLRDGSALVTGLLLGLTLPPTVPLWIAASEDYFYYIKDTSICVFQ